MAVVRAGSMWCGVTWVAREKREKARETRVGGGARARRPVRPSPRVFGRAKCVASR